MSPIPPLVQRDRYAALERCTYFNQASLGLIPVPTVEAMHAFLAETAQESLPLGVTLLQRKSAHGILTIVGVDGVDRRIEVAALPLLARTDDFVGAIALFWEHPEDR